MYFRFTIQFGRGPMPSDNRPHARITTFREWTKVKQRVKHLAGDVCHYCGTDAPDGQVDHVIPVSRGGTDEMSNLVWACRQCNNSKRAQTPAEWRRRRGGLTLVAIVGDDDELVQLTKDYKVMLFSVVPDVFASFLRIVLESDGYALPDIAVMRQVLTADEYKVLGSQLYHYGLIEQAVGGAGYVLTPDGIAAFQKILAHDARTTQRAIG